MKYRKHPFNHSVVNPSNSILSSSVIVLTTRQGTPQANTSGGISLVTTLPAPITVLSPIVTPGHIIAPVAIHTLLPIFTGLLVSTFYHQFYNSYFLYQYSDNKQYPILY